MNTKILLLLPIGKRLPDKDPPLLHPVLHPTQAPLSIPRRQDHSRLLLSTITFRTLWLSLCSKLLFASLATATVFWKYNYPRTWQSSQDFPHLSPLSERDLSQSLLLLPSRLPFMSLQQEWGDMLMTQQRPTILCFQLLWWQVSSLDKIEEEMDFGQTARSLCHSSLNCGKLLIHYTQFKICI